MCVCFMQPVTCHLAVDKQLGTGEDRQHQAAVVGMPLVGILAEGDRHRPVEGDRNRPVEGDRHRAAGKTLGDRHQAVALVEDIQWTEVATMTSRQTSNTHTYMLDQWLEGNGSYSY